MNKVPKVTNIHISLLKIIKHLNSEVKHYTHLANTYPNDPRFENNLKTIAYFQAALNYFTGRDDTAVSEETYDFIADKYKDLVAIGMWVEKEKEKQGIVESVESVESVEDEVPLIAQTVQPDIPEVEKVVEAKKKKKKEAKV